MKKTTKQVKPTKFEPAIRQWLQLQGGEQDAPIKICEGATLVTVTHNPYVLLDLAQQGKLAPELGRYVAQQLGESTGSSEADDHRIRLLHQSDGFVYGVVSMLECGCYSLILLGFQRNGTITSETKASLWLVLDVAEKIAHEKLAQQIHFSTMRSY